MAGSPTDDPEAPYGRKKDGTPKKPAGFQRGGALYNGEPRARRTATGEPDRTGPGWGGPAKGPLAADWSDIAGRRLTDEQRANKELRLAAHIDNMEDIALNSQNDQTRLSASIAVANRLDGTPAAKVMLVGGNPEDGDNPVQISDRDRAKAIASIVARAREEK